MLWYNFAARPCSARSKWDLAPQGRGRFESLVNDHAGAIARRLHILDNGARIVVLAEPHGAIAALQLWVAAGTCAERPAEHGAAHLLEHMLFKPREGVELATAIEALGGDVNAFTSHDETVVHVTVPAHGVRQALQILLDAVLDPAIDAHELANERDVVLEEIHQYADDPGSRAMETLVGLLYPGHGYGRPILGESNEVAGHRAGRLRAFHRRAYAGPRLCLVAAGAVDEDDVVAIARPRLAQAESRRREARDERRRPSPLRRCAVHVERADVAEAHIRIGWVAPSAAEEDAVALDVASVCLGHGESARLPRRVRRQAQLVSDVHASFLPFRNSGSFLLAAQTVPERAVEATAAVLDEVEHLTAAPLEHDELERARAILRNHVVYRRETPSGEANALGFYATVVGDLDAEARYFQQLEALDPESIRAACRRVFEVSAPAIVLMVPEADWSAAQARGAASRLRRRASGSSDTRGRPRWSRPGKHGVVQAVLPSGLRVLGLRDDRVPMAAGLLVWPGGLRLESPRRASISYLAASLLNRGTEQRDASSLALELDGMAASLQGFAGRNSVGMQFDAVSEHFPRVLARAIEAAARPAFPHRELEEERRIAIEELVAERDDLAHQAYRLALAGLYGRHPYARAVRGTEETLARVSSTDLERTWSQHYGLGGAVLGIAGANIDDDLLTRLQRLVEEHAPEARPVVEPIRWPGKPPAWPRRSRIRTAHREREQAHLVMAYPGFAFGDSRQPSLDLLTVILGGQSGRLFRALREEEGLVYHVGMSSAEGIDAGHVVLQASTSQSKLQRTRAAIALELERIQDRLVDAEEFERARAWLLGQHALGLQRRARLAAHLAFAGVYGLKVDHFLSSDRRVAAVTRKSIRAIAREVLAAPCSTGLVAARDH